MSYIFHSHPSEPIYCFMQEDTAGNKYYSEFMAGYTGPIKTWVEKPKTLLVIKDQLGTMQD